MIQDRFGREIVDLENGIFAIDGMTLDTAGKGLESAISTFNAMQPEGWTEPKQPLDAVGVMATLNVVLELWTLEDAANAVGLQPEDLIAEAEAWAAARDLNNPL